MEVAAIYLAVTLALGFLAVLVKLPPLVGFLAAGFLLNWLEVPDFPAIDTISSLGVALLLFGIGLKLNPRTLVRREVWVTASAHMVLSVIFGTAVLWAGALVGLPMLTGQSVQTFALLAFALSFSSTVFVVKVLEERGESHSLYGRVAVGILVIQDIAAVIFLTVAGGHTPSPWAAALILLWPAAKGFRWVWSRLGHGEMQSLFGVVMALVPGYWLFTLVGLDGDLGALVMGLLLSTHKAASELSRSLFHIKELLLVGFFVSIGLTGLPDLPTFEIAIFMVLLLPFKAALYFWLLWLLRLRLRTSLLAGLSLMNYSEFGLIVVSVGVGAGLLQQSWLVEIAIAVALSFVVAAIVNGRGHLMVEKLAERLPRQPLERMHPEELPADAGNAEVVVLGMGRVGVAAFDRLQDVHGLRVVGVDYDDSRVRIHQREGRNIVLGDATDLDFWNRLRHSDSVRTVVLAMHEHGANVTALDCLRESGYDGHVATVARYQDEVAWAREHGVDEAFNIYAGAGAELADQASRLALGDTLLPAPDTPEEL